MTLTEALAFLEAHQPMPDDAELSQDLIEQYDEVRKFFLQNPDERCIGPLLASFGDGDGFGVYQLVEDVLKQFDKSKVVPHLKQGLHSSICGVRYWNAEIAANFPSGDLVADLSALLRDPDQDIRAAAVIALGQIKTEASNNVLRNALAAEANVHVRALVQKYVT
jgi:hypothetical protein